MNSPNNISFSIIIPLFNEEASIVPLYVRLTQVLTGLDQPYEIIFVDDGSKDTTPQVLDQIYESDSRIKIVSLRRNFGQTAALKAGFDVARGEIVISMDGDLQHDPEEIPVFIAKLADGYDIVSGWRTQRRDRWLTRRLPSRTANWMMAKLSGVPLHDFGTTFKAYRREIIQNVQLYGDLHRFIPALAAWSGARIAEVPINNPPRRTGNSNYGFLRMFHVILDLMSTKFLLDYSTRPLHFFGFFGLLATGAGTLIGAALVFKKLVLHKEVMLENGPLLFAATVLILAGIQFLCLGLVSEILSRTYYESQGKPIYAIKAIRSHESPSTLTLRQEHGAGG
ncbi:MAG TPA: glycosyltransferase family 2 protein [Terriglobia bacterium]|nr:glycosyltransferase family 2 protein [Terriglobia bacterium]